MPGLNFLDRIVTLCRVIEGGKFANDDDEEEAAMEIGSGDVVAQDIVKRASSLRSSFGRTQMADLRVQLAYIGKHILCRMQELDGVNLGKVVTLLLEVIVQSNH